MPFFRKKRETRGDSGPELAPPDSPKDETVMNWAQARLGRKAQSTHQLREYLLQRGAHPGQAEQVVGRCVEYGFLNDESFATLVVRAELQKKKGPRWIAQKLKSKGVPREEAWILSTIRDARRGDTAGEPGEPPEIPDPILEAAREWAENKARRLERPLDFKEKQKIYAGLVRRGFSHEIAREICSSIYKLAPYSGYKIP